MLNRVITRVYAAPADCQREHEQKAIVLCLLAQLRDSLMGAWNGAVTVDTACHQAHGCAFSKWSHRNTVRESNIEWFLAQPTVQPQIQPVRLLQFPREAAV